MSTEDDLTFKRRGKKKKKAANYQCWTKHCLVISKFYMKMPSFIERYSRDRWARAFLMFKIASHVFRSNDTWTSVSRWPKADLSKEVKKLDSCRGPNIISNTFQNKQNIFLDAQDIHRN